MARKMPARDSKGRFVKKGRGSRKRSRSNPRRKTPPRDASGRFVSKGGSRRKSSRSRSRARRNPPNVFEQLPGAAMDAVQITVGKAGARMIPGLIPGIPTAGIPGKAAQIAAALALGFAAGEFLDEDVGRALMVGGLSGVVEGLIVEFNVPYLAPALADGPGGTGLYSMGLYAGSGNGNRMLSSGRGGGQGTRRPRGSTSRALSKAVR